MVVHVHLDRVGAFLEACFHYFRWCILESEGDSCKMQNPHDEFGLRKVKYQSMMDRFG